MGNAAPSIFGSARTGYSRAGMARVRHLRFLTCHESDPRTARMPDWVDVESVILTGAQAPDTAQRLSFYRRLSAHSRRTEALGARWKLLGFLPPRRPKFLQSTRVVFVLEGLRNPRRTRR